MRSGGQLTAEQGRPLAHPDQPVTAARPRGRGRRRPAGPVVSHLDGHLVRLVADPDARARRPGVPGHVGQRLLHDAVRRQVRGGRQRADRPVHGHVYGYPGRRGGGDQAIQVGQARKRGQLHLLILGVAQDPDQQAHLVQRPAGGGLDDAEGLAGLVRVGVDDHAGHPGPHRDHAHRVGHDVVQFPGDLGPLVGHGPADLRRPLRLCGSRLLRGPLGLLRRVHPAGPGVLRGQPAQQYQDHTAVGRQDHHGATPGDGGGQHRAGHEAGDDQRGTAGGDGHDGVEGHGDIEGGRPASLQAQAQHRSGKDDRQRAARQPPPQQDNHGGHGEGHPAGGVPGGSGQRGRAHRPRKTKTTVTATTVATSMASSWAGVKRCAARRRASGGSRSAGTAVARIPRR